MFGRRKPSLEDLKTMRPTPDDDGVTRVFPKALWDDPKMGDFLRQMGMDPARRAIVSPRRKSISRGSHAHGKH